jgi:WhiB family redox-sensing transcriptional regulator
MGRDVWQDHARCQNEEPEIFFSQTESDEAKAKKVCQGCPVIKECRAFILSWEKGAALEDRFGIYAGLTAAERFMLGKPQASNGRPYSRPRTRDLWHVKTP